MSPSVSVIMPLFNAAAYVGEAIESVLYQIHKDWELIICNDGSTDNSLQVAQKYAKNDPRIRIIENKRNLHIAATMNHLLQSAQGEFVAILDGDDTAHSERLSAQVNFLRANPQVDIVGSWYTLCDSAGGETLMKTPPDNDTIKTLFLFDFPFAHATAMFRRTALQKNNLTYDTNFSHTCDYLFFVRALPHTRLASIPRTLYRYRQHDRQVSKRNQDEHLRGFVQGNLELLQQWGVDNPPKDVVTALCGYYFVEQSALPRPPFQQVRQFIRDVLTLKNSGDGGRILRVRLMRKYLRYLLATSSKPIAVARFLVDFGPLNLMRALVGRRNVG